MKNAVLIAVVSLMLTCVLPVANSQASAPEAAHVSEGENAMSEDWPQWRGPNRDGIAAECPPLSWPPTGPKLMWKSEHIPANLEGGFGSVSIADGRVYVFVSWQSGFNGATGPQDVIVCLDEASGKTLWMTGFPSVKTDHPTGSVPCVAAGRVFAFGSQRLYCMDAETGSAIWQSGITGAQISASPLFADGLVFALSDALRAYDPDGNVPKLLWEQPKAAGGPSFEGVDHTSYNCSPAVWRKDGVTYVITCGDKLTCVNARSGAVQWQAPGPGGASATPAVHGDTVVINYGLGRGTYAYHMTVHNAEQLWRISKSDRGTTPVIVNGHVFQYGAGSYTCYDLFTGQEKWKQRFGGEISSPIAADGKIFGFYSGASAMTVFNATAEKFDQIDTLQCAGVVASSPAIANGRLYVRKGNCVACYGLTRDPSEKIVLPPLAVAAGQPLRILLGSTQDWTDAEGRLWSADRFVNTGEPFATKAAIRPMTDLPHITQSGRRGLTGFALHLVNGVYTVRAHFCETDEGIAEPGLRVMTLYVNDQAVEEIDPLGDTGARGIPRVAQATAPVQNGLLKINLVSQSGETLMNALEILPGELPAPPAIKKRPMPLPVAPVTAPSLRSAAMKVGVIDMPMVRHQSTSITASQWFTHLENAAATEDRITVQRITSLNDLMKALAHPETWLGIINPYGEAFPVPGPTRWKEVLAGIRQYVRHGGHWFETGGFPFFEGFFQEDGGVSSARIMDEGMDFLGLRVGKGPQKAPLDPLAVTAVGQQVLGEQVTAVVLKTPCEINRPLPKDDGHLALITAGDRDYMGAYSLGGWGQLWRIGGSRVSVALAIPVVWEILHFSYTHPPVLSNHASASEPIDLAAPVAAMSRDWPQWRGPNRDGIVHNGPPLSWSAVGPKRLWQSEPLPSMEDGGFGSVTVANGKAYVLVDWKTGFNGLSERHNVIVCLDKETGRTLWKKGYPVGMRTDHATSSVPCVADNRVFVCGVERLYCLDANSGAFLWKTAEIGKQISSSPLALDGMVIVSANSLFAYDAATGKEIWHQDEAAGGPKFEGVPHTSNNCSPVLWRKHGINYVINCGTRLTCVEARTGVVQWQAPGPGCASATPAIWGDTVVINYGLGRGTYAYQMSPDTAEELWHISKCDRGSTPVILDGYVYAFGAGSYACYDLITGQEMWKARFSGEISSPVAADGKLFGFYDGCAGLVVFKATAAQYSEIDRLAIRACHASTPTIADGRLFVRAHDGVACYALTPAARTLPLPPLAAPAGQPIRINVGAKTDWTDPHGNTWTADRFADDGSTLDWGNLPIPGTELETVYQSERRGVTGYRLHVANGDYTVRAHFCENYEGIPAPGLRVMTLDINGAALRQVDPFGETGGRGIPLVKQVHTAVTDGLLKIDLLAHGSDTILNGLEILPGTAPAPKATQYAKPQTSPQAPDTSPGDRGVAMAVGIIDIPALAGAYAQIKPEAWVTGLQKTRLPQYDVAVKRITTVEDLVSAMARPAEWLAIINPYGEHFVAAGPGRWQEMVASIRHYVRHGGNWWEMGGYPLYQSQYYKDGDALSERVLDKGFRFLGLGVGKEAEQGPVAITPEGETVIDKQTAKVLTQFACATKRGMPADSAHVTLLKAGDADLLGGYQLGGWGWLWRFVANRPDEGLYVPAAGAVLEYLYTHPPKALAVKKQVVVDVDAPSLDDMKQNWPCFRGANGSAYSTKTNPPLVWDMQSGAGVLWKVPVREKGYSSPIVWDDRVFLSGERKNKGTVLCFQAKSGDLLWQRTLDMPMPAESQDWEVPESAGMAAATMATDGRRAYAMFANGNVAAFDFQGNRVWARNLGMPDNTYGHTASLALWGNRLIVQMDQGSEDENKSRLIAINGATGETIWERHRPVDASWTSPIVVEAGGKHQILTLSTPCAIAYDAIDGSQLWRFDGIGGEATPSPIFAGGLFFVISPYEALYAIKPDGQGNVTDTHVAWFSDEWVPDICSPVSNGDLVFTLMTSGLLTCFDVKDGTKQWEHDFDMEFQASPAIVGNRLYLFEHTGKVLVMDVGREFKELARSDLGEPVYASPAFVRDRIYIRTAKSLICIGEK